MPAGSPPRSSRPPPAARWRSTGTSIPSSRVGGALVISNILGKSPFSRERTTTAITYLFFPHEVDQGDREILADRLVERRIEPGHEGFVGVTGALPARTAQADEIKHAVPLVELGTVLLVALVVGFHFRAVGAPLANLLAVAIAYLAPDRIRRPADRRVGAERGRAGGWPKASSRAWRRCVEPPSC